MGSSRKLGTIEGITDDGRLALKMDSERGLIVNPKERLHLDHGYVITSHGQTAQRVLIHLDTELAAKNLLNNRMARVSSRVT